jgi:hypothetical protein
VEKLARYVDNEEKIWVKLIVSAHLLERIFHVASTGSRERRFSLKSTLSRAILQGTRFVTYAHLALQATFFA